MKVLEFLFAAPGLAFLAFLALFPFGWLFSVYLTARRVGRSNYVQNRKFRESLPPFELAKSMVFGTKWEQDCAELEEAKRSLGLVCVVVLIFGSLVLAALEVIPPAASLVCICVGLAVGSYTHREKDKESASRVLDDAVCQPKPEADKLAQKFLVSDYDEIQGAFTRREICVQLNDGKLSRMALVFENGVWLQPHEVGIVYDQAGAELAPNWAG